jgi:protein TonB
MDAQKGSAAASTPGAPTRIRVGGNVQDARVMHRVDAMYPPLAKQARIEGTVALDVLIAKDGHVMQVQNREGPAALIQAAVDAVKQWIYEPTLLNGNPVEVSTTVDVNFRLP